MSHYQFLQVLGDGSQRSPKRSRVPRLRKTLVLVLTPVVTLSMFPTHLTKSGTKKQDLIPVILPPLVVLCHLWEQQCLSWISHSLWCSSALLPTLGIWEQQEGNEILHDTTAVTAESALPQRGNINN